MKKLSQETFVAQALARAPRPVDLSKFNYTTSAGKSIAACPQHGDFIISANALMNGSGCSHCAIESRASKRRTTLAQFIEKAVAKHNGAYSYDTVVYTNAVTPVEITCPTHGAFLQAPTSHLSGRGCPACANERVGTKSRMSQAEFKALLSAAHPELEMEEGSYTGMMKKVGLICPQHGRFEANAGNVIYNKSGCPTCARKNKMAKRRHSFEACVKQATAKHNGKYQYVSLTRDENVAWLTIVCPEHGEFKQRMRDHLKGSGCARCTKPVFDTASFVYSATNAHAGKYTYSKSNYKDAMTKVAITCPEHGEFHQLPACHVALGQGCPTCARVGPSKAQLEIKVFLEQHLPVELEWAIPNSRSRIDVLVPQLNLGVEYHGLIWHSSKFKDNARRDYKKHRLAEKHGIRLIHIFQDEWKHRADVVKRTLLSAIGKLPKLHARKLRIVEVGSSVADDFYVANHLQGAAHSSISFGLMEDDALVACMSFSVSRSDRRNTDTSLWELDRYASTATVVGGASRLLSAFKKLGLAKTIVSYSDTRAFSGRMYEALGFKLAHVTPPDYKYTNGNASVGRIHKSKFQRKHLATKFANFDPSLSESENCRNNGWFQIFDCGKKKWVLELA